MGIEEAGMDRGATRKLVREHNSGKRWDGRTHLQHAESVADRAERYCVDYFNDSTTFVKPIRLLTIEASWHAGLMHELIEEHSVKYEDICFATNSEVADAVAAVTRDPRMPHSRREMAFAGQISTSPIVGQIVAFADIVDNMASVSDLRKARADGFYDTRERLTGYVDILNALRDLLDYPSLKTRVQTTNKAAKQMVREIDKFRRKQDELRRLARNQERRNAELVTVPA